MGRLLAYVRCLFGGMRPPPPKSWTDVRQPAPGAGTEPPLSLPLVIGMGPGFAGIRPMFVQMDRANQDRGAA